MKKSNTSKRLFEDDDEIFGKSTSDAVALKDIPVDAAKAAYKAGGKKDGDTADDQVVFKKVSLAAIKLKPSQKELVPQKAVEFAFSAIMKIKPMEGGPGGDLGAIVSNDNYIMDGHHRWAATFLVDPSATLDATQIDLPGAALVTALNVVTKGIGRAGQAGTGNISQFAGAPITDAIDLVLEKGYWAEKDPAKCKAAFEEWGGSVEDGKKKMLENAKKMPKQLPSWAPARVDMPVIKQPEVMTVAKAISQGVIDIKPPYSPDVKDKLGKTESVIKQMENYYLMRTGKKPLTESIMKRLREYNKKNQTRLYESYLKSKKKIKLEEKLMSILRPMVNDIIKKEIKNRK